MSAADYQLDFNGTVIGDGTAWDVVEWGGMKEFTTRGSDVSIPNGWGSIPGNTYVNATTRVVTVESVNPVDILLLEAALTPPSNAAPDTLVPIRWKFPLREEFLCYGRCSRRAQPVSLTTALGLTQFTFELEFPDPRVYSAVLQQASLTVFTAGLSGFDLTAGAGADIGFDLTAGAGVDIGFDLTGTASTGLQTITNSGYVDTYPIITFSPATGISSFSVTNQTTGQTLTINQTLNAGQTLIANMQAAATSTSGGTTGLPISIGGVSVYGSWQAPRIPLRLVPGANILRFDVNAGDTAATALVTASSAYL